MHFMVNWMKENLQSRLVSALYREDRFEALLHESPQVGACASLPSPKRTAACAP